MICRHHHDGFEEGGGKVDPDFVPCIESGLTNEEADAREYVSLASLIVDNGLQRRIVPRGPVHQLLDQKVLFNTVK